MNETMFNFHPTKSRKKVNEPKIHLKNPTSCATDTTQDISTAFEEFSTHEHPHGTQKKRQSSYHHSVAHQKLLSIPLLHHQSIQMTTRSVS